MILAYLAYPIDVQLGIHVNGERSRVRQAMKEAGWCVFEPGTTFYMGEGTAEQSPDPRIQQINDHAITKADVVVALLPIESHSVGVPLEIHQAATRGKTVFVWRQKRSWAIAQKNVWQFNTIGALCEAIANFKPVDAGLWDRVAERGTTAAQASEVHVQVIGEGQLPTRKYADDAGFDLHVEGDHVVRPQTFGATTVPCSVAVELPPGWWGLLVGRSSTFNRGLVVNPGIIDPGYRGELFAAVYNLTDAPIHVGHGARIAQFIPIPAFPAGVPIVRVDALSESERGTNGFGSTGL